LARAAKTRASQQATGGGGVLLRRLDVPAAHVRMSPKDKAPLVHISDDGLSVQSSKARRHFRRCPPLRDAHARCRAACAPQGYRMARATHGAASGAWYCEARVEHLGATGHARLGWCGCGWQRRGAAVVRVA
jgi:Set1/Ash2 histone methyltransferase complex subunit ASH2